METVENGAGPSGSDTPRALNLFLTGKCNLNCRYCFVNKTGQERSVLDEASIRKSIDLLFGYPGKRKVLSFNGGEPLTEWPLLRRAYLYAYEKARENGVALDIVVVSNGTLLTQGIVDFFVHYGAILKISIDGDKETHDRQRPFLSGTASSFDSVLRNLERIDWKGLPVAASLVFTPESVDRLVDNVRFLAEKGFGFVELYPDIHARWDDEGIVRLRKSLKAFSGYYVDAFRSGGSVFKNSLLDSIVNDVRMGKTEGCPNIQLDPDGNFYVCDKVMSLPPDERYPYRVGNAKSGLDEVERKKLLSGLRKDIACSSGLDCGSCEYEKYCFCPIGSRISALSDPEPDPDFWRRFCLVSGALVGTFVDIARKLEYDERFVSLYRF